MNLLRFFRRRAKAPPPVVVTDTARETCVLVHMREGQQGAPRVVLSWRGADLLEVRLLKGQG